MEGREAGGWEAREGWLGEETTAQPRAVESRKAARPQEQQGDASLLSLAGPFPHTSPWPVLLF